MLFFHELCILKGTPLLYKLQGLKKIVGGIYMIPKPIEDFEFDIPDIDDLPDIDVPEEPDFPVYPH